MSTIQITRQQLLISGLTKKDFEGAGPSPMTVLYGLRVAVVYLLWGIHDNLGSIKPQRITAKYPIVFYEILPLLKRHRNDLAHKVNHATDAKQIEWMEIWGILEHLSEIEKEISEALVDFEGMSKFPTIILS